MSLFWQASLQDKEWIRLRTGPVKYAGYVLMRMFDRARPGHLMRTSTAGDFVLFLLRLTIVALISFTPVIFVKWVAPEFHVPLDRNTAANNSYIQAALLFGLQAAKYILDRINALNTAHAAKLKNLQELSVALDQSLSIISKQIKSFASAPEDKATLDSFLQHALKCIETTVRLCTGNLDDGSCCVTLLTFESNDQMQIRSRSVIGRSTHYTVPQGNTFAYLAAKYAPEFFSVQNFRFASYFRKAVPIEFKRLTSIGGPEYKSILCLPLPAVSVPAQNRSIRKGTICVDAARPYQFLGREIDVLIRVQAYLNLVNLMLTNHDVGIELEK